MDPNPPKQYLQALIRPQIGAPISPRERWIDQASDKTEQTSIRIEAVENIATEFPDHTTFQRLRWILETDDDDLAVRCAIVRVLPKWGDPLVPNGIVRALSLPGVRAVAVETLEKMSPATGQRESRLIAALTSLRRPSPNPIGLSALGLFYGRDHRVLSYLRELLRTGNRWERAMAASELLGLGEVETALIAARDVEPRVRKSLAVAIGWYREERGAQVLGSLLEDPDYAVASEARRSTALLSGHGPEPEPPAAFIWRPLLKELSEFRLADANVTATLPEHKVEAQWLGEPGAAEPEIETLERRLGRRLPPSYRSFLAESDGFEQWTSLLHRLYSASEVDWFRARNSSWAEAYRDTYPNLGSCLQVSDVGDAAVVLLNPDVVAPDGEWQTYFFANWIPGANTHDSFQAFMEDEMNSRCEWRNR